MIAITLINALIIIVVVIVHYEGLLQLSILLPKLKIKYRFRVALGLMGALLAHIIEVWIFGFSYYILINKASFGHFEGVPGDTLLNCVYFSFVSYTSLGYGDQVPVGLIRYTAGLEALTGLVLIAMTASFMYFQIEKFWSELKFNK